MVWSFKTPRFEPHATYSGYSTSGWAILVNNFYATSEGHDSQTVDDEYLSFIWSLVLRQSGVRVGLMPEGVSAVWITPQPSQVRKTKGPKSRLKGKGKAKAVDPATEEGDDDPEAVDPGEEKVIRDLLSIEEDVYTTPLSQLRDIYGDQLHIASDPKTTFAVLTGSHTRVGFCLRPHLSALSSLSYTAFQT